MRKSLEQVFDEHTMPEPMTGCLLWIGYRGTHDYGHIMRNRKAQAAHRIAWEMTHGPIPEGLRVCHKCDTPPCVNPDHLFLGTDSDNQSDSVRKGRQRPNPMPGERHPMARLSEAQVAIIRDLASLHRPYKKDSYAPRDIAKQFKMSEGAIYRIIRGERWRQ